EVAIAQARKSNKMFNFRLRFLPNALEGMMIGGNFTVDQVPKAAAPTAADPMLVGILNDMTEIVWGVHFVYQQHQVHFIAEGAVLSHREEVTNRLYRHYGGFVEVGYSIGDFMSYVRYEYIRFDAVPDFFF